ncbi:MAG: hypothetical protein M0R80_28830 [Proteobacteria bacterium]|jgi:hypothetical protein|nr:hypothetical protein [Pseudomonadota bacterium]
MRVSDLSYLLLAAALMPACASEGAGGAPQAPVIPAFHRDGFTVAEWGVMVK